LKTILRECLRIARVKTTKTNHPEFSNFPHFSFVIWNNKILKWGTNSPGNTPIYLGYPAISKTHAEFNVLKKCAHNMLNGAVVVNIRLNREGDTKLSAPCKSCKRLLKRYGITSVYYSVDNDNFEFLRI
jgi:hypothetical protein